MKVELQAKEVLMLKMVVDMPDDEIENIKSMSQRELDDFVGDILSGNRNAIEDGYCEDAEFEIVKSGDR